MPPNKLAILASILSKVYLVANLPTSVSSFVFSRDGPTQELNPRDTVFASQDAVVLSNNDTNLGVDILDMGQNYEGFPTFEVVTASGDTSHFQVTFAESKAGLSNFMSDGPLPLAAAMDTYRINRHNITGPTLITHRLIQGGFRYLKLNLSTNGILRLRNIGVKPTTHTTPLTELPGSFQCSDDDLTRIWHTGARTAQLTEIPKDTIPDFWQITENGALIESAAAQVLPTTQAAQLQNYELTFEVKPLTGEFGFSVLANTLNEGIYTSCDIVTGKISAHAGATSLSSTLATATFAEKLPGSWHSVQVTVNMGDLKVALDNTTILDLSQSSYFAGSFGLGASFGHSAYFRNLRATTLEGTEIYSSSLTDDGVIGDFQLGLNPADTIVDGSRRDRIAYNGDLDVALGATLASTFGTSFIYGTLELLGSYQAKPGFFIPTAKIQQAPLIQQIDSNLTGLIGYSFNLVAAFAQTFEANGDLAFAQRWAPVIVSMLDWAHSQTTDGLFTIDDPIFAGDWNYYDPPQLGASSKFNAVYAYSIQQSLPLLGAGGVDVGAYNDRLKALRAAMHNYLWDETMGAYVMSDRLHTGYAQDANSLAILAGVPQAHHIEPSTILSTLSEGLLLAAGPLAFSNSTIEAGFAQKISPYASAYHLRAALQTKDADTSIRLLKTLWAPMADPSHANYTNCFWETLNPDGTPGLGLVTSLCHGWGAGPTAELSAHVLGIQAVTPGFKKWRVKPLTLGLHWAKGRYRTVRGDVHVDWRFDNGLLRMEVEGPEGGVIFLPEPLLVPVERSIIRLNGAVVNGTTFQISAGKKVFLEQTRKCM